MIEHTNTMKPEEIKILGYKDKGFYKKDSTELAKLVMESTVKNKTDLVILDVGGGISQIFESRNGGEE